MEIKSKTIKDILKVTFSNACILLSGILVGFLLPKIIDQVDYGYYKTFTLYIAYIGLFQDMKPEDWNRIVQVNLNSVFHCSRLAILDMLPRKSGKIVNISSVWGITGASCEVAYSATKGAVNAMTRALAKELGPSNIQVNAVACGAIDTEMNHFMSDEELIHLIDEIPMSRLGKAEEVADLVYHLSYKDTYLTGQVIALDGGWI